jgi:pimeloyl-ACP methyl ester carboxylesterase
VWWYTSNTYSSQGRIPRESVVAPDLRGYNLSQKPESGFGINTLTCDILAVIKFLGKKSESKIVGHDWGVPIACWAFASRSSFQISNTQLATNPKAGGCVPAMPSFQQMFVLLFLSTAADI